MFKLCRQKTIRSMIIFDARTMDIELNHFFSTLVDHRLNRDAMEWNKTFAFSFFTESRNKRFFVENTTNAVAADFFNDRITLASHKLVRLKTNIASITSWSDCLDALVTS